MSAGGAAVGDAPEAGTEEVILAPEEFFAPRAVVAGRQGPHLLTFAEQVRGDSPMMGRFSLLGQSSIELTHPRACATCGCTPRLVL